MNYADYADGTQKILLFRSDFKSESRFEAYATFLREDTKSDMLSIPIDIARLSAETKTLQSNAVKCIMCELGKKKRSGENG